MNKEDVIYLHELQIKHTGGKPGIADINLLESVLGVINQSFSNHDFYPTIVEKVTRLSFGLNKNHVFNDGNK